MNHMFTETTFCFVYPEQLVNKPWNKSVCKRQHPLSTPTPMSKHICQGHLLKSSRRWWWNLGYIQIPNAMPSTIQIIPLNRILSQLIITVSDNIRHCCHIHNYINIDFMAIWLTQMASWKTFGSRHDLKLDTLDVLNVTERAQMMPFM